MDWLYQRERVYIYMIGGLRYASSAVARMLKLQLLTFQGVLVRTVK